MNDPEEVQFCPVRTNIDWSNVQFAEFEGVEVTDFSNVKYFEPSPSDAEDDGVANHNEEDKEGQKPKPAAQEAAEEEFAPWTPQNKNRKSKRKGKGGLKPPPPPSLGPQPAPVAAENGGDESKDSEPPSKPDAAKEDEDEGPISDKKGAKGGKNAKKNAKKKQKGKATKSKDMVAVDEEAKSPPSQAPAEPAKPDVEEAPALPADAAPETVEAEAKEETAPSAEAEATAEVDKEDATAEPESQASPNGEAKAEEETPEPAEPVQEPAAPAEGLVDDAGASEDAKSEETAPAADPSSEPIEEVKDEPSAESTAEPEAAPVEAEAEPQPTEKKETESEDVDAPTEPAASPKDASADAEPPKDDAGDAAAIEPDAHEDDAPAEEAAKDDTPAAEASASEKEEAPEPVADAGVEPAAPESQDVEEPAEVEPAGESEDAAAGPSEPEPQVEAAAAADSTKEAAVDSEAEADEAPAPAGGDAAEDAPAAAEEEEPQVEAADKAAEAASATEEPASVAEAEADTKEEAAPAAEAEAEAEATGPASEEKSEPGSPSTKQVRFADEPVIITMPLSRDGGDKTAKKEAEAEENAAADEAAAPSEQPAVVEAPAENEASAEEGDTKPAEGDSPASSDEPATTAGAASEEPAPATEEEEEPELAEDAPASDKDAASPDEEAAVPSEAPAGAESAEAVENPAAEGSKDDMEPVAEEEAAAAQTTEAEPEAEAAQKEEDTPAAATDGEPAEPSADAGDDKDEDAEAPAEPKAETSEAPDQPAEEVEDEGERPGVGEDTSKDEPSVEATEAAKEATAETAPIAEDAPVDAADEPATEDAEPKVEDTEPANDNVSELEAAAATEETPSEDKDEAPAVEETPDAEAKETDAPSDTEVPAPEPEPTQDQTTPAEPEAPAATEPEAPPPAEPEEPREADEAAVAGGDVDGDGDKGVLAAEQEPSPGDIEAPAPEAPSAGTETKQATVEDADAEEEAQPQADAAATETPGDAVAEAEDAEPEEPVAEEPVAEEPVAVVAATAEAPEEKEEPAAEEATEEAAEAPKEEEEPAAEESKEEAAAELEPPTEEAVLDVEKPAGEVPSDADPAEAAVPEDNAEDKPAEGAGPDEAPSTLEDEEVPPATDAPEAAKDAEEAPQPEAAMDAQDAPEPEPEEAPAVEASADDPAAADAQEAPTVVPTDDTLEAEAIDRDIKPTEDDGPGEDQTPSEPATPAILDPIDEEGSPKPEEPEAGVQEVHGQEEESEDLGRAIDHSPSDAKAGEDDEDEAVCGDMGGVALAAAAQPAEELDVEAAQEESAPDVGLQNEVDDSPEGAALALDQVEASAAESEPCVQAEQESVAEEATPVDVEPPQDTLHDGDESESEGASGAELTGDVPLGISDENAAAETLAENDHADGTTPDGIETPTPADEAGGISLSASQPEPHLDQEDALDATSQPDDAGQPDEGVQLASGAQTPIQAEPDTGASIDATSEAAHAGAEPEMPAEPASLDEAAVHEQEGEEQAAPVTDDSEGDSDGFVFVEKDEAADKLPTSPMEPANDLVENLEDEGGVLAEPEDSSAEGEDSHDQDDSPPDVSDKTGPAQVERVEEHPPWPDANEPEAVLPDIDHEDEPSPAQPETEKEESASANIDVVEGDKLDLDVLDRLSEAAPAGPKQADEQADEQAESQQIEAPIEDCEEELQLDEATKHNPDEPADTPSDAPEAEFPLAGSNGSLQQSPSAEEAAENSPQEHTPTKEVQDEQDVLNVSLPVADTSVEANTSAEDEAARSASLEEEVHTEILHPTAAEEDLQLEEVDASIEPRLADTSEAADENVTDEPTPQLSSPGGSGAEALLEPALESSDLAREVGETAEPDPESSVLEPSDEAFDQIPELPAEEEQPQEADAVELEEEVIGDDDPQLLQLPGSNTTMGATEALDSSCPESGETDNAQPDPTIFDEPIAPAGEGDEPAPDAPALAVEAVEESSHEDGAATTDQAPFVSSQDEGKDLVLEEGNASLASAQDLELEEELGAPDDALAVPEQTDTQPEASAPDSAEEPTEAEAPTEAEGPPVGFGEASEADDTIAPAEDVAQSEEARESLQVESPVVLDPIIDPSDATDESTLAAIDHAVTTIPTADEASEIAADAGVESAGVPEDPVSENPFIDQEKTLEEGEEGHFDNPSAQDGVHFSGIDEHPEPPADDVQPEAPAELEATQLPSPLEFESNSEVHINNIPSSPDANVSEELETSGLVHELESDASALPENGGILHGSATEDLPEPSSPGAPLGGDESDEKPEDVTGLQEEAFGVTTEPHLEEHELNRTDELAIASEPGLEELSGAEPTKSLEVAPELHVLPEADDGESEETARPDDAEGIEAASELTLADQPEEHGVHASAKNPVEPGISEPVDDSQRGAISEDIDAGAALSSEETVALHDAATDASVPETTTRDVIISEANPSAPEHDAEVDAPIDEVVSSEAAEASNVEPPEVVTVPEVDEASLKAHGDDATIPGAMISEEDSLPGEPVTAEEQEDLERLANPEGPPVEETVTAESAALDHAASSETEFVQSAPTDDSGAQLTSDYVPTEEGHGFEETSLVGAVGETSAPGSTETAEETIVLEEVAPFGDDNVFEKATEDTTQPEGDIAGDGLNLAGEIVASGNRTASQPPTPTFDDAAGLEGTIIPAHDDASEEPVTHDITLPVQYDAPESPGASLPGLAETAFSDDINAIGLSDQALEQGSLSARDSTIAEQPEVLQQVSEVDDQSIHNFQPAPEEARDLYFTLEERLAPAVDDSRVEEPEAAAQEQAEPSIAFQEPTRVSDPDQLEDAPEDSVVLKEIFPSPQVVNLAQYSQGRQPDEASEDHSSLEREQTLPTVGPAEKAPSADPELPHEDTHVQVTCPSDEENVDDTPDLLAASVEDPQASHGYAHPGQLNLPELRDSWAYAESDQFDLEREIPILEDLHKRWAAEAGHEANAESETDVRDKDNDIPDGLNISSDLADSMTESRSEGTVNIHSNSEEEATTAPESHQIFYEDRFHQQEPSSDHLFPEEHDQTEHGTAWLPSIAEEESPIDSPERSEASEEAVDSLDRDVPSTPEAVHPSVELEDEALSPTEDVPVVIRQEEPLTPQPEVDNIRSIVSAVIEPDAGTEDRGQEDPDQRIAESTPAETAPEPATCSVEPEEEPETAAVHPEPIIEPHVTCEAEDDVGPELAASDPGVPAVAEQPIGRIKEEPALQSYFADLAGAESFFSSGQELTPPPEKHQAEDGSADIRSLSSADLASPHAFGSQVPLLESFPPLDQSHAPEEHPTDDRDLAAEELKERLQAFRADSTEAEGLPRTGTSMPYHIRSAISSEFRAPTPSVEIPDLHDPLAMQMSRARSVRRRRRHTLREAEETIAAAVVIYAAAEALSPPHSPPLGSTSAAHEFRSLDVEPVAFSLSGVAPAQGADGAGRKRSIGDDEAALRNSVADLLTERKSRELPKAEADDAPRSPRSRRMSHHSSRSSRPSEADKDSGARSPHLKHHHHHHHRRRADSEHSGRSGSEAGSPMTSKRADSGLSAESSRSSEAKKHRTPEEQAAHERRKEEKRRLIREKEKALEAAPSSPRGSKGKGPETTTSSHKSSRRTTPKTEESQSPSPSTAKRFLALKGESVLESNFSIREGAESSRERPDAPRRSTTSRASKPRPSVDGPRKAPKSREEVEYKSKDKDIPVPNEAGESAAKAEEATAKAEEATAKAENEHRRKREEQREKEKKGDQHKGGLRAVIKRFFTT